MKLTWIAQVLWTVLGVILFIGLGWGLHWIFYVPTTITVPRATVVIPRSWTASRIPAPAGDDRTSIVPRGATYPTTPSVIIATTSGSANVTEAQMRSQLLKTFPTTNPERPTTISFDGHQIIRAVMTNPDHTVSVVYVRPMVGTNSGYIVSGITTLATDAQWRRTIEEILVSAHPT